MRELVPPLIAIGFGVGVFYVCAYPFARKTKAMHAAHPTDPENLTHEQVRAGLRDYPWVMPLMFVSFVGVATAVVGMIWLIWRIVE